MSEYEKQANAFAKKYGVKLINHGSTFEKHFMEDKEERFIFDLELTREEKSYRFEFGQSISAGSEVPNMYDVLSCLTKWEPGTFENFCDEFGYNDLPLSKYSSVRDLYEKVVEEYRTVVYLFEDVMDELCEVN